jgi:hypothetical protein
MLKHTLVAYYMDSQQFLCDVNSQTTDCIIASKILCTDVSALGMSEGTELCRASV